MAHGEIGWRCVEMGTGSIGSEVGAQHHLVAWMCINLVIRLPMQRVPRAARLDDPGSMQKWVTGKWTR